MAISDIFVNDAALIIPASSYTTGGTDLGRCASAKPVAFSKDVELMAKQTSASLWNDARLLAVNLLFEVILLERTTTLMGLLFPQQASAGNVRGIRTLKAGKRVTSSDTSKLLFRPVDTGKPYLYIPRALVTSVEPITWSPDEKHLSAAKISIAALLDGDTGEPWYYGDTSDFPSLAPATPVISSRTPTSGPAAGGTKVLFLGTDFNPITSVTFGGTAATILYNDATSILVSTPAHATGAVTVVVTGPGGSDTEAGYFTYT